VLARHAESTLNVERVMNGDPARDVALPDSPHHKIANATPYLFSEAQLAAAAERLTPGSGGIG
jgi:hypothetical protein